MLVNLFAISSYAIATLLTLRSLKKHDINYKLLLLVIFNAILFHGISVYNNIFLPEGFAFGLAPMALLISLVINVVILTSHLRKPLLVLLVILLPLSIITLATSMLMGSPVTSKVLPGVLLHIVLSILAYSLLSLAVFQALLLAWQIHYLKNPQTNALSILIPPLQTMESVLFKVVLIGILLLSAALVSGFYYIDNIFAQDLVHKTVLSIISWLVFVTLLIGHHWLGWRGNTAVKWILCGFCVLMLAFFGSKAVLELILRR